MCHFIIVQNSENVSCLSVTSHVNCLLLKREEIKTCFPVWLQGSLQWFPCPCLQWLPPYSILNNRWVRIFCLILLLADVGTTKWQSDCMLSLGPLDIQTTYSCLSVNARGTHKNGSVVVQLSQHLTDELQACQAVHTAFVVDMTLTLFFPLSIKHLLRCCHVYGPSTCSSTGEHLTHPTAGWVLALLGLAMPFQFRWPPTVPLQLTGTLNSGWIILTWVTEFVISFSGIN